MSERLVVGSVQPRGANRHVAACRDTDSLWVEIAGPKGGGAWQMTPPVARELAHKLMVAADMAASFVDSASTRNQGTP